MTDITGNYRNTRIIPIPLPEDSLDAVSGKRPDKITLPSTGSSSRSREEYKSTHIGKLTFPRQIVEDKAYEKCIKMIFTAKLSESLYPIIHSYNLGDMYKIDRLARQMFYEIACQGVR